MTDIQTLIRQLRAKGWSIAAIADELQVNYYTIYRWQEGQTAPSNPAPVCRMLTDLVQKEETPKKRRFKKRPPSL